MAMSSGNLSESISRSLSTTSLDIEVLDQSNNDTVDNISMSSVKALNNEYILKIIQVLELDDSMESEMIAKQLMSEGRQALYNYEQDVPRNIFQKQMHSDQSELLGVLKSYVEQQWKQTITEEWFQVFIRQQMTESFPCYDKILTRTAEYGSKFIKNNALLSLIIQFLFELDDETIQTGELFDQIWNTLISDGRQGVKQFKDYIAPTVLKELLENDQSVLYMALRDYFRQPLNDLFSQKEVNIAKPEVNTLALDCVSNCGWWNGLHDEKVRDLLSPNKFKILIGKLLEYLKGQNLPIPNQSCVGNSSTDTLSEQPILINSSLPHQSNATISSAITSSTNQFPNHNVSPEVTTVNSNDGIQGQEQQRIRECKLITMCINEYEKLQLSDLVEAGELMYIDQKLDHVLDVIIQEYRIKENFSLFINACLTPVMYLLKRHQNLDDFTESLFFKYSQVESISMSTKLSLRMIMHILLLNSDLSLSRKIMSLLSKRNPVPFLQPSLTNDPLSYQFVSDIIHVWNYSIPTILSFGIGPCFGKSTIINTIFLSSFEQSLPSIYFQNTIDIDFGYSFLPRRSTNIADAHGLMSKTLLEKIHELFDGFIIHIEYAFLCNNIDIALALLDVISKDRKYRLLIVRDVPTHLSQQCSTLLSSKFSMIDTFILPNIADQNNKQNKHCILTLRDKIWDKISNKCLHDMTFLKNELKHLMNDEYKQELDHMYKIIVPLERTLLKTAIDENSVKRCFSEYLKFAELCELKLKLARFNFYGNENDAIVYDVRRKMYKLENESDMQDVHETSIIYELFCNVLKASNMLTYLELLTNELKQERAQLVSTSDMAKQLPIQKSLSVEVLWRNAIVCSQHQSADAQKFLKQKYYEYIRAGFPFEIVDGDNFFLQYSFLLEAFEPFRDHKTLVISVIGPQNSGKSTLLNYMFGTLFDVRDGRCTRGIYGSFVKTNRTDFEYIMLIDTEGLLGVEREDPEYDRRIVLFCLAVSHLVIVNMIGDFNTTLQTMLTLCTDSLEKMGVTRIPQPIVHFILNQKADLNIENNEAAIDRIISDMIKFGLGQSIDISKETFHTLPSAFKKEGHTLTSNPKLPNVVKTAPEFIECVQSLCGDIIRSAEPCLARSMEFSDPLQWLSSSRTIFDTLQQFPDLTYYRDIYERRLDNEIREHIRNDLTRIFSADYRDQLIVESFNKNEEEVQQLFLVKQNKIQETARQNFEELFKRLKVPDTLRTRSQQFINVQITEMFNALRTSTSAVNEREKVKLIVRNGEGDLQKLIEDTINSGQQMPANVASQEFEEKFNNTIQNIKRKFVPDERLKQAIKHIYTNYNIYEKECLSEYSSITHYLSMLSTLNETQVSIAHAKDELIIRFTYRSYQNSLVNANNFNPTTTTDYSLEIIKNLVYLNKELLERDFLESTSHHSPYLDKHQQKGGNRLHNRSIIRQAFNYIAAPFRDSKDNKQAQQSIVTSTDEFQMNIRNCIQNQKPNVLKETHIDDSNVYFSISKVFKEIIERIMKVMQGVGNHEVRQIQTELIQKILGLIDSLIHDIDNELSPFCLTLSRPLKSIFHTCAVILLTKYYYDEQINHFSQTLSELNTKKDDLEKYFISMVVPNASVDENYAVNLGKQFKEHLIKSLTNDGQLIINTELKTYDYLNRQWMQARCDGQLMIHNDDQWHLDYIENPTKIIEQFFNELWKNVQQAINQKLTDRKSYYVNILTEFFHCLQGMLDTVRKLGSAAKFVDDIFISEESNSLDANKNLINKKRCMTILLHKYFTQQTIPTSFMINGKIYQLRNDALDAFQSLMQQRMPTSDLCNVTKEISSIYDKISIGNFVVFLEALLKEKNSIINDLNQFKSDFNSLDTEDTYARLLDKVRGCPDLCPCCKRPCDVDHTQLKSTPGSKYNEHRCRSGHTLRAMNGYKFEVTEEASLLMCEQIKDDQVIVIGPARYEWSQFKSDHADWIFESALNDDELNRLHGKFLTVWEKIGSKLCEKFQMKYVTYNTSQRISHQAFHYILLLDGSGSMGGDRWEHLMKAVQEFLTRRDTLKAGDRITIIIFSEAAKIAFFDEEIQNIDVTRIQYPGGGTSFNAALACVNKCITKSKSKSVLDSVHNNYAIVFMSDGEAEYPEKELDRLLKEHDTVIKNFWTLALGDNQALSMEVLKQINDKMNGSFYDVTTSTDLIRVYAEVATSSGNN